MKISEELIKKIEKIFPYNMELSKQLIELNGDAIRSLGEMCSKGINPEDVIDSLKDVYVDLESGELNNVIESLKNGSVNHLYNKALRTRELSELYKTLILEYAKQYNSKEDDGR